MSDYNSTKYDDKAKHGHASGEDLLSVSELAKIRRARLQEAGARGAHVVGTDRPAAPASQKYISIEERRKRDEDILKKAGV